MIATKHAAVWLLVTTVFSLNNVGPNYELTTDVLQNNNVNYYGIKTLMGTGGEKSNDKLTLEANIGYHNIIIGDKNKANWGIDCSSTENNTCEVTDPKTELLFYHSKQLAASTASLHLRIDTKQNLNVTEPVVDKIPAKLVNGGNSWNMKDWGVLGLSPQGSFSKYFSTAYNKAASLLLLYNLKDKTVQNEDIAFDFRAFINVEYNDTSVAKVIDVEKSNEFWSTTASIDFISPAFSFKDTNVCFNTITDEIIQVIDVLDRCDAVKKLICDNKIGPDCTKNNANFEKAPKLVIQLGDSKFEFHPDEYLYYRADGVVDCRFGDGENLRVYDVCDPRTELGLGKLFFQKYIPVFKYNHGQNAQIVLLNQFTPPVNPDLPANIWIWIILGIVGALVIIGAIVAFVMKKKSTDEDAYYANYQNVQEVRN
jgi:hypothetical protein